MKFWLWLLLLGAAQNLHAACNGKVFLQDGRRYDVEIAASDGKRARGLMFREALPPNAGMLFLYPQNAPRAFWMKNTYIPLDMVFYDHMGQFTGVQEDAEPLSEMPRRGFGAAVLEVNSGEFAEHAESFNKMRLVIEKDAICPEFVKTLPLGWGDL